MTRVNYKIYNKRNLGIKKDKALDVLDSVAYTQDRDVLDEAAGFWYDLDKTRRKRKRNGRYTFGQQWEDKIESPDGRGHITERQAIMMQGKTPLQNNMIRRLVNSVLGQFRANQTEPVCVARDTDETKVSDMMTIALQSCEQRNEVAELDADMLQEFCISAMAFQKVKYDYIPALGVEDGFIQNCNPARMFWNSDMEDLRTWDVRHIGEIHDLRIADVVKAFAKTKQEAIEIRKIYEHINTRISVAYGNMTTKKIDNLDFYVPQDNFTCRVIESWKFESKERLRCIDELKGEDYWLDVNKEHEIKAENTKRIDEGQAQGVDIDDIPLITYDWGIHQYWYCRFFSPDGHILFEAESPYWHTSHPYVFRFYSSHDGEPHSFVEDVIDPQRMLNRMYILQDFVISSGAKNPLIIDEEALNGQSPESIAEAYVKVGSVIVLKPKVGVKISDVIQQLPANNNNIGTYEMINLMMSFMNDISGVHSAMLGREAKSGTPSSLYAQEAQQAAMNIMHLLSTFNAFKNARDVKLMKVLQQYYDKEQYINIAGVHYSEEAKRYNPQLVRNAELDISLAQSTATAAYRSSMDTFLLDMFKGGAISIKMLLENSNLPFKDRLLQSIESAEQQAEEGQMQGFSPDMMQEMQGQVDPQTMAMLNENVAE